MPKYSTQQARKFEILFVGAVELDAARKSTWRHISYSRISSFIHTRIYTSKHVHKKNKKKVCVEFWEFVLWLTKLMRCTNIQKTSP